MEEDVGSMSSCSDRFFISRMSQSLLQLFLAQGRLPCMANEAAYGHGGRLEGGFRIRTLNMDWASCGWSLQPSHAR
jgi:hypothetical protein